MSLFVSQWKSMLSSKAANATGLKKKCLKTTQHIHVHAHNTLPAFFQTLQTHTSPPGPMVSPNAMRKPMLSSTPPPQALAGGEATDDFFRNAENWGVSDC